MRPLWLVVFALSLYSQTDTGMLTGRVTNAANLPVAASKVMVQKDGHDLAAGLTDTDGYFHFAVPAGRYILRAGDLAKTADVTRNETTKIEFVLAHTDAQPQFFDEPQFTVAGVTDNTYRGGHGSDSVLRSSEALTQATVSLSKTSDNGDPLDTVRQLQRAAEADPSENNLFNWGTELLSHRAPAAAAAVFSKGADLFPRSTRMRLGLGSARYAAGWYEKAAYDFFAAVDVNPNDPGPYAFLNQAQQAEITQSPGYQERLARFVQMQPQSALANYYYGFSLSHQPAANAYLQKAVALDPQLAAAHLQLGIVYFEQMQYKEAISEYQITLRENPASEETHYRLAEVYRVTGQASEAARETAIFKTLSEKSSQQREQERREVRQFVIALKNATH